MADILNLGDCATLETTFNTGLPLCDIIKKKLIGVIFLDKGVYFTAAHRASVAAFLTELGVKTTAARGSRAYPLWNLRNYTDETGQPTKGGLGNLTTSQVIVADGIPAATFGYKGGEIQHAILSKVEAGNYDIMLVDEAYRVYGTKSGDNMVGFSTEQIYVNISKWPVTDYVNQYSFSVTFGSMIEFKANSVFVVINSNITLNVGLNNVTATLLSSASNVHKVILTESGGKNMEVLYGTAISGATWTAKNVQTGASFTVTSVADSSSDDSYAVTLDSTAWTALSSGYKVEIFPPTPALLAAASVKYFESSSLIVTK